MNKLPIFLFIALFVLFAAPLLKGKDPSHVESAMIGRPVPVFSLPPALEGEEEFSSEDLKGHPSVVNVFASWCVACRLEQGILEEIGEAEEVKVYGLNYKDTAEKVKPWLERHGDPYDFIGADPDGRVAIDWGVYGVPETFVVDAAGIIRYKHLGPVTDEDYRTIFKPLLEALKK